MFTRSSISQLGMLFKVFRESKGLTQSEVVKNIESSINRSVVAHLEQGLRLPQPHVLREIGEFLGIPEQLWSTFESDRIRERIGLENEYATRFRPQIIAISGVMGSGKTTLAQQLSRTLGYKYIAESKRATQYLDDLFNDPSRWAFEVQTAFLFNKANEIRSAIKKGYGVVIDRTLSEDKEIFAKHFCLSGDIDQRSYELYVSFADYFINEIPSPDVVIYCDVSKEVAINRIRKRSRVDSPNHTDEHVLRIYKLYKKWICDYKDSTIFKIDGEKWDWREPKILYQITREIEDFFNQEDNFNEQLSLFDDVKRKNKEVDNSKRIIKVVYKKKENVDRRQDIVTFQGDLNPLPFPSAYIAAPFTGVAGNSDDDISEMFVRPHGTIKRGKFKDSLLEIERNLAEYGITSLIPHRDVNEWGKKVLVPKQVTSLCTEHVVRSDLFVGIIGNSHGSHYEFGIARGLDKPCLVIHCSELGESFISEGVVGDGVTVMSISCERLSQIGKRILDDDVKEFLLRHFS